MSVPTDKRKPSIVQYVTTAQELHHFTVKKLTKLPGKYKSYIYDQLASLVGDVMDKTTKANGLNRLDDIEYQERKMMLKSAVSDLITMYKYVDFIFAECNKTKDGKEIIKEGSRLEWYKMIKTEINLISGVLESDRKAHSRKSTHKGDIASD